MSDETGVIACFLLFVDDSLIGAEKELADKIAKQLMDVYEMTHQGQPTWFLSLGVEYNQSKGVLRLSQEVYVNSLLDKYDMTNCNPAKTPAAALRLTAPSSPLTREEKTRMTGIPYRNLVGALLYLMLSTRPEIAFAVIQVAKFSENPSPIHWTAVKRILRYLKGTAHYGITYTRDGSNFDVQGFVDSDWAGDTDTRRSTAGYVFTVLGGPVSWTARLEKPVAQSSCVAELIALNECAKEAIWERKLLRAFGVPCVDPMVLFEDNQGCIAIANNQKGMSSRTKHVATRYFAVRQFVENGEIMVTYIPSTEQLADIFTKPLTADLFVKLTRALGLSTPMVAIVLDFQ
jgi:hypothetical protein